MATTSSGVVTPGIDMGAGDSWDAPPPEQRQINAPFNADDPRLVYKPTAGDQSAATLGSALGTKLPAIPGAAPALPTGAPPVRAPAAPAIPQQTLPEMAADSSKILASKDTNQMLQAQLKAQQQSGEEERKANVQEKENIALRLKQQGEADSLIADRKTAAIQKHQADLQESSPFAPTQESAGDLAKLFSLLSVAAFSSGGKGKYAGMQAMSAMTGAMKGYKQGQKEVYDKEVKNFEENLKVLKTHNDKIDKIYNDAMELMAVDKDKGIQKMRELIAEDNTGIAKQLAQSGRYKELGDVISTARKSVMEADKIVQARKEKLSDRAEERSYQAAKLKEEHRYQEEKARIAAAAKIGQIGDAVSYVNKFTGGMVDKKTAPEILLNARALGDAYGLKAEVAKHPEWVGRSGQIKNFFNRTIESINSGTPSPDDQGQPELVFAKRYAEYLVNYERSLAGGAKGFTVNFQNRFNTLLGQNQFNATGFSNLMDEQMRTIVSQASSTAPSVNKQNLTDMALDIKTRAGDEDTVDAIRAGMKGNTSVLKEPSVPKEKATTAEVDAYAKEHYGGDVSKATADLKNKGYL